MGDLKTPKEHFEINWPLVSVIFWGAISTIDNFIQETCLELHHNISHHQMQNPHELVKKEEKKKEKYPRWYKSCIDPWFYFLPDLQFAEKEWIQRLCRTAMIWRVFFLLFYLQFLHLNKKLSLFLWDIFVSSKSKLLQNLSWNHNDLMSEKTQNLIFFSGKTLNVTNGAGSNSQLKF